MTDRIDLDDIDTDEEEPDDEPNRGDWFWRGEGDPADEPDDPFGSRSVREADTDAGVDEPAATDGDAPDHAATPRVPRQGDDKPVGIPIEGGGAGSSPAADRPAAEGGVPDDDAGRETADSQREATGAAPHGEDADDMTMALTYRAAKRLAHPASAFADAEGWADWIGIVGRVETPVINRFQRQNGVDADFFSGTGTGPGERLAEIGPRSMFYAKRMVVVGVEGEDERVAAEADWEFVPLTEAAEKAGWTLEEE